MFNVLRNIFLGAVGVVLIAVGAFVGIPKLINVLPNMVKQAKEKQIQTANDERPFSLKVATFRNEEDALISVQRLRNLKLPAYYVPCLTGKDNLWYNVHIGSYTNIEDAKTFSSNLVDKYPKLEIEVENYSNYVSNYVEYQNEFSTNTNQFKKYEVSKAPSSSVPTNFIVNLYQFPVDKRYNVVELIISRSKSYNKLYRYAGFLAKTAYFPTEKFFYSMLNSSHSFSYFLCQDKLFNERMGVLVFEPKDTNSFITIISNYEESFGKKITNVYYKTKDGIVKGNIYENTSSSGNFIYTFVGENVSSHHIVTFKTFDMNLTNLLVLFKNDYKDKELLIYPEILRGLAVLPEDLGYSLEMFDIYRLGWSYAEEKNNAWWAVNMVGHWNYESYYIENESEDFVKLHFFDLIYKSKAQKIYNNFSAEKEKSQYIYKLYGFESFPVYFGNIKGWYLKLENYNEISFNIGSFIIAVDSYYPYMMEYSKLKYISERLIYKNVKSETNKNEEIVL